MSTPAPVRPNLRWMLRHGAHCVALGFGSGLVPRAPGTAGTLWAWGVFAALQHAGLASAALWALALCSLPLGWWACTRSAAQLQQADPACIVWDEIAAFWLLLCALQPASWAVQWAAFALFRFFDAVKPQPVRWADAVFKGNSWRGGWGIMFDDLVAAACTLGLMWPLRALAQ